VLEEMQGGHLGGTSELVQRVEAMRERIVGPVRARGCFGVEGLVVDDGATLYLHGEVSLDTAPHLDAVLDGILSLEPSSLTVDLRETATVDLEALMAIARKAPTAPRLCILLPEPTRRPHLTVMDGERDSPAPTGQPLEPFEDGEALEVS
jgi:hypothetical protein